MPNPALLSDRARAYERRPPADNACLNPWLAAELDSLFGSASVVDIGCGVGSYGMLANLTRGPIAAARIASFDGSENIEAWSAGRVRHFDLTLPADVQGVPVAEWALMLEVAEHVPTQYEAAMLANVHALNRRGVVLSLSLIHI